MVHQTITATTKYLPPSVRHGAWTKLVGFLQQLVKSQEEIDQKELFRSVEKELSLLRVTEPFCAYPGLPFLEKVEQLLQTKKYHDTFLAVEHFVNGQENGEYVRSAIESEVKEARGDAHYFEVLIVADLEAQEQERLLKQLKQWQSAQDQFIYKVVVVDNFADAEVALLLNSNIQAVVVQDNFKAEGGVELPEDQCRHHHVKIFEEDIEQRRLPFKLADAIHQLRPEVDVFLSTYISSDVFPDNYQHQFSRIFHRFESLSDLHNSLIRAIATRYETPFFGVVENYSRRPVGAFHALPISRGNSVLDSPWTEDFCNFYGNKMFLGESSSTSDGLESLINPHETVLTAQAKAAECFGANQSYFVTNGTTMSNKIVHQAITQPGDIVLIDRSCHESQHFAFMISGASPYYLRHYSLDEYSIAGGIPLKEIKRTLLEIDRAGLLHKVKMIALTNCTFDGMVYNVRQFMEEIWAIVPDAVIFWDEAWFAFARFLPHYRQRTGMFNARLLAQELRTDEYRTKYARYKEEFLAKHPKFDESWIEQRLLPDPDKVSIRTYSTQSTHKTLSSFRQGSMIHVYDEHFDRHARHRLRLAFLTHTTSSPSYQILSSLDVARRQASLEGYQLASRQVELARTIRHTIRNHPLLSKYFKVLSSDELVPEAFGKVRELKHHDWGKVADQWSENEFVLDPCRITVYIADIGVNGATFREEYLAKRFGIQVNKTGFNTVCFMTNIGTSRSAAAYLIESLIEIAKEVDEKRKTSKEDAELIDKHKESVMHIPPLPQFSSFYPAYQIKKGLEVGDIRTAYFDGCVDENVVHIPQKELGERLKKGEMLVSSAYVIPYPPGYPVLVPGQILDHQTFEYLDRLHPREILGYDHTLGARFFTKEFLDSKS
jgi:arginine decarboxylase